MKSLATLLTPLSYFMESLVRVLGHRVIVGNFKADKLTRNLYFNLSAEWVLVAVPLSYCGLLNAVDS